MARRKIITINEDLCNGCGNCIVGCAEGALQLVNGKAKLVKENFCDGFGDCIGTCPTGALKIEERDSEEFDFDATIEHVAKTRGEDGVKRMKEAHAEHEQQPAPKSGGCPGRQVRMASAAAKPAAPVADGAMPVVMKSEITQWPLQLHLVPPEAPFFKGRELVILSTCSPVTSPDVHWRYVRGRSVVVACPKLDQTDGYVEKLAGILSSNQIPRAIILRMSVPCCGGLTAMVAEALKMSSPEGLAVDEVTMSLEGEITNTRRIYG
jgi:NAD-dependent dihydropyrimidine dehydrogenase PreA subunit